MNFINNNILTIVIFLPLAGAILLAFLPRRDRDVRYFALGVSLITLLASLHLPWYYIRGQGGISVRAERALDPASGDPLSPRPRRNLIVAGRADHVPHAAVRVGFVEVGE